jgi:hypothetical protein
MIVYVPGGRFTVRDFVWPELMLPISGPSGPPTWPSSLTRPASSPVVPVGSPFTITNSWGDGPVLETSKLTWPAATVVADGVRNMSPSPTVTLFGSVTVAGAGFVGALGLAAACAVQAAPERAISPMMAATIFFTFDLRLLRSVFIPGILRGNAGARPWPNDPFPVGRLDQVR